MSYREKTAWISLVAMVVLTAWYFHPFLEGQRSGAISFPRLALAGAVIIIISTLVRVLIAAFNRGEAKAPPDEREQLIEMKGRRISYAILAWAVRIICFVGIAAPAFFFNANTLLFFLMISEVIGFGYQLVQFRQGA